MPTTQDAQHMRLTPDTFEQARAERERRWAASNPVEMAKELALMERAGVAMHIIAHCRFTMSRMKRAFETKYPHTLVAL